MSADERCRMAALADPIAEALGGAAAGWVTDLGTEYTDQIVINGPAGERLQLRRAGSHRTPAVARRMTVFGLMPEGLTPHTRTADGNPTISVDSTRPAAAIAREVRRRVLPGYAAAVAAARLRQVEEYAEHRVRDDVAARIAAHLHAGPPIPDHRERRAVRIGNISHRPEARFDVPARIDGDAEIAITCTAEQAVWVAELLAPLLRRGGA